MENKQNSQSKRFNSRSTLRGYALVTQVATTFVIFPLLGYYIGGKIGIEAASKTNAIWGLIIAVISAFIINVLFIFQFVKNEKRYEKYVKGTSHNEKHL